MAVKKTAKRGRPAKAKATTTGAKRGRPAKAKPTTATATAKRGRPAKAKPTTATATAKRGRPAKAKTTTATAPKSARKLTVADCGTKLKTSRLVGGYALQKRVRKPKMAK